MKKIAIGFLILSYLLKVALCAVFGQVVYTKWMEKTWSEARDYCREHHTDLISISNLKEEGELGPYLWDNSWIGLYLDANDTWRWSDGTEASYFHWKNPGKIDKEKRCVIYTDDGWRRMNCEEKRPFDCYYSSLVLVKENKTWEQALAHCRQQDSVLVNLDSESALIETLQASEEAQTDHVWVALRYLGDRWLWLNGKSMKYQAWSKGKAPQCQAWSHNCGVLSLKGENWESWDCTDKLNFVCS